MFRALSYHVLPSLYSLTALYITRTCLLPLLNSYLVNVDTFNLWSWFRFLGSLPTKIQRDGRFLQCDAVHITDDSLFTPAQ